jgi:glycolate oxidase FAD binding subunit
VRGTKVDDELTAFASEVGKTDPVAVVGARTRWLVGGAPDEGARLVRAPSGVLEHRPEEMTVRVRAGTTVAELDAVLGAAGQRTALPDHGGTVGGALAVSENDLRVLGRGQVRHCVLEIRYVSAEGAIVTGGAPTVKNVSGFDLPRLMVGSLGTLGLIAEAVLRTNPIPTLAEWFVSSDADPFAVRASTHHPSAVLWDGTSTWLELEGHPADLALEREVLDTLGTWEPVDRPPDLPPYRWSLRPSDLRHLDRARTGAFVASIGVGIVFAAERQQDSPVAPDLRRLSERVKSEFDPSGRLNPGRDPMRRN